MSRSYKKNPVVKENLRYKKDMKRQANKAVRNAEDVSSGREYKKVFESWNINDYKSRYTKDEAIQSWLNEETDHSKYQYLHTKYKTLERWLNHWKKMMLGK